MNNSKPIHILSSTPNGLVYKCNSCSKIHIEYKNLNFNFTQSQYDYFANYFNKLDADYWEDVNKRSPLKRKIVVPIGHDSLNVLLNRKEIEELRKLLLNKSKNRHIQSKDIGISLCYN